MISHSDRIFSVFSKNRKAAAPPSQETVRGTTYGPMAELGRLYTSGAAELRSGHVNTRLLHGGLSSLGFQGEMRRSGDIANAGRPQANYAISQ